MAKTQTKLASNVYPTSRDWVNLWSLEVLCLPERCDLFDIMTYL